ncbi:NADH-quinone oxidoreductase subunit C [Deinococcus aquatilis]|uniref:NADH-quinone oxidoreductase subunit C n=1 Tax=Deinococcus aquatilis TaxID=519440 RepID=UPI00035EE445|nr:NADH-quinone oxidoreductase subunit C [Deinococcus aquatilis]
MDAVTGSGGDGSGGEKLTGRNASMQSSQSQPQPARPVAETRPTPVDDPSVGRHSLAAQGLNPTDPRDVKPLMAALGLTEDDAAEPTAVVPAEQLREVATQLKARGFMLMDTVGIDYSAYSSSRPKRFAVLHNVYHPDDHRRLFLRVWLDDGEALDSLYSIWKSANYLEREVYDLMGVEFVGHPDLRKVLTPDDLEGHPLRKDFPLGETPTLFREGRFLDPAAFRAGLSGQQRGLTGYRGELRRGQGEDRMPPVMPEGGPK